MTLEPDLYELLYVSCVVSGTQRQGGLAIAQESRGRNERIRVSGLLLFDGKRFAQHIEGAIVAVERLFASIEADSRHNSVQVLQRGTSPNRKFRRLSMGYAILTEEMYLEELSLQFGPGARDSFTALLSVVDF